MTVRKVVLLLAVTLGIGCSAAFAATLGVGSTHLWAGSQTLTKGTCTVTGSPTTDTYVDEHSATSSFGGSTTLAVGPRSGQHKSALIRFDLSGCNIPASGGADSATLRVTLVTAPALSQTIDVTQVFTSWSGSTTWNDAQTFSYASTPTASFVTGTTDGATKTVTVTGDVDRLIKNGTSSFGWRLDDNGGSTNRGDSTLGSAENATAGNRPQLTIDYEK